MSVCSLGGLFLSHFNVSLKIQSSGYRTWKMMGSELNQGVCGSLQGEQSPTLKAYPF